MSKHNHAEAECPACAEQQRQLRYYRATIHNYMQLVSDMIKQASVLQQINECQRAEMEAAK